jgi:hypothetical protein
MIDLNVVIVTKISQVVSDFEIQLIKVSCDSIFKFVMNEWSQNIIFIIVVISLNVQMIDEFVDENTIRNNKIQFIFEENFVSKLMRLSFSAKWKILKKLFVDDDFMMIMLLNKLKICCMKINKIKKDEFDLKNSTDQCKFSSTRDTQRRHCELRWFLN